MNQTEKSTVITIDDHPLFRKGVADLITMSSSLELIGEASNCEDGLRLINQKRPDLILLDINMKQQSGLSILKEIKKLSWDTRVLMLTVSDNENDVLKALREGADGYLLKDMEPEDILSNLHAATNGKFVISPELTQMLAVAIKDESDTPKTADKAGLTEREREILDLIAVGLSNKVIASELEISEGTVKVHVKHLLKKLKLHSRVEAAVWALKQDI